MKRFPDGARVLFIGDSITNTGLFMAHVYDCYLRRFPGAGIRMYNAGVSGGSTASALAYYDRGNGENYRPTHAVVMLGVNEVGRDLYRPDAPKEGLAARRMDCLRGFESRLRSLTGLLGERGVRLTLLAPTGVDETLDSPEMQRPGCDAAIEYMGERVRLLAEEIGADFFNMHAAIRLLRVGNELTRPDRIHPNERGYACMARAFLAAQGLCEEPGLDNLPPREELLEANRARFEAEQDVRALWNAEWLILRGVSGGPEEKLAYMRSYQGPGPFFQSVADRYLRLNGDLEAAQAREWICTEQCVNGGIQR